MCEKKVKKVLQANFSKYSQEQIVKFKQLAIKCLADLLASNPSFNFSKNVIQLLIPTVHSSNKKIANIALEAIGKVLELNNSLDSVLEVVQLLSNSIKNKSKFFFPPPFFFSFLAP